MAPSSPYATFRAEEWMRASQIRPRKLLAEVAPVTVHPPRHRQRRRSSCGVIQGELFLYPVVAC
jgi:hypothetical protein